MKTHADTQVFPPAAGKVYEAHANPALVVIRAGAGSVAVEADIGDGSYVQIPGSPFTADTVFHLNIANGRFRFTPSGGALYGYGDG